MRFGWPSVSNFPENRLLMLVLLSVAVCMSAANGAAAEMPAAFQGSWSPVVEMNGVDSPPDSQVGGSEVVRSKLGAYRQGGSRIGDRFVYRFRLSAPNRLVRATVRYPDDRMRAAGVSAWGPPQEALGSGFMCGDDIPLSHRMVTRRFVFYSRDADAAIVFSTEAPNQPVAIASLKVEEAPPGSLPAAPPPALGAKDHRRMGLTWEDPILARCFGEPDSVDPAAFDVVLHRFVDYSKWVGLSEINYPAYWYTGPIYDSKVAPNYPIANRLHPPDALIRLAKCCESNDIAYVPVLNVFKLRSFKDHLLDEQGVIAGKPNVNTVDANGRVVTWNNARFWQDGAAEPLNPIVQDACRSLLVEVATRCAPFASFKGIDLALWPGTVFKLGSSTPGDSSMSFDDYVVNAFCADLQLHPPGVAGEKDRFARRAKWLRADPDRWHAWLKWRAARMTRFYVSLADRLAAIKPGAKLGMCVYMGYGRLENEGANINDQIYASGIDLDALSLNRNIRIKRYGHQMLQRWRLRNGMPRPKNLNIENTATFQAPFLHRPRMGFIVHQQYFETRVDIHGNVLSLPPPFLSEKKATQPNRMIRVTEPLPTGRDYLRFFAGAVANYDPFTMSVGGYVLGTQGAEQEVREMARAFSALPAVNFEDVLNSKAVVVRRGTAESKKWAYAVNLTACPRIVRIAVRGGDIADAVTGQTLAAVGGRALIHLKPYELKALCGPASMKVLSADVEVSAPR